MHACHMAGASTPQLAAACRRPARSASPILPACMLASSRRRMDQNSCARLRSVCTILQTHPRDHVEVHPAQQCLFPDSRASAPLAYLVQVQPSNRKKHPPSRHEECRPPTAQRVLSRDTAQLQVNITYVPSVQSLFPSLTDRTRALQVRRSMRFGIWDTLAPVRLSTQLAVRPARRASVATPPRR